MFTINKLTPARGKILVIQRKRLTFFENKWSFHKSASDRVLSSHLSICTNRRITEIT